ncbi:MAG: hypothetical protein IKT58_06595 [Oscillospiraceae bacterium]|nr:hypothetical protein [Oscillospiraceae bacterium]
MKKTYEKPAVFCEDLHPEEMLCGCAVNSPLYNEAQMCNYPYKPSQYSTLTYNLFANDWATCDVGDHVYCYHVGQVNLFGS